MAIDSISRVANTGAAGSTVRTSNENVRVNETAQAAVATQAAAESSTVTAASQEQAARDNNGSGEGKQSEQRQTTMKDVSEINKVINQNTIAEFGYNEPTNRITIKIKDKETNEVIREIPSEKALEMLAKAWELAGLMVDERR